MKGKIALTLSLLLCLSTLPVQADEVKVVIEGEQVVFTDAQPVVINSRTMVPLRGVFEKLGYEIFWKADTKTAVLADDDDIVRVRAGSNIIRIDDDEVVCEVAPQIINGRMYLPLREISEATDIAVDWDKTTKTVKIGSGQFVEMNDDKDDDLDDRYDDLDDKYDD